MFHQAAIRERLRFLRGNMAILTLTQTLGMFGRSLAFPYASLFILALGGEPQQVGLINSLAPLAGLIAFPIAGYLSDHTGRVKLMAIAGFVTAGLNLLYVVAPSWEFIIIAALLGGITVMQFPPSSAIIADSLAPQDRGRGVATMNMISGIPALLAPYAAGALIESSGAELGMRMLYGVMFLTNGTSALIHLRYLRETAKPTKQRVTLRELVAILKSTYRGAPELVRSLSPSLKTLSIIVALGFLSNAIAGPFWVVYAIEHIGLSTSEWGLILLIETATLNLAYIPAGMMVDRCGRSHCMRIALGLTLVCVPLFVIVRGFWFVLVIRAGVAVANAFFMPACTALMADIVPRESRGRVMAALGRGSVMLGAASGGTGGPGLGYLITLPLMLASFSSGYLYALGPTLPWVLAGAASFLALILSLVAIRDPQKAQV